MTTTAATEAPAKKADGAVKVVGILVLIAGIVMIVAGAFTWASVSSHLKAENILRVRGRGELRRQAGRRALTAHAEAEGDPEARAQGDRRQDLRRTRP